jgi:tryptophanase
VFKTIIEPFRIKTVQPIRMTTRGERGAAITEAGFNVYRLRAEDVLIDFLTDSGTGAMSDRQWAALLSGDEAHAGSSSFFRFRETVRELTGFQHVLPTHQGRTADEVLFGALCSEGDIVPSNHCDDGARRAVEAVQAKPLELPCSEASDLDSDEPFKGDMDVEGLARAFQRYGRARIPVVVLSVTSGLGGGQPLSFDNLSRVSALCHEQGVPLFLDASRFAENAFFIKVKEAERRDRSVRAIVADMFARVDGCTMSAQRDGLANIGGFVATNDPELAARCEQVHTRAEGLPTYAGLAGRDLEAMAVGLKEVVDEGYLKYRLRSIQYLGEALKAAGVPLVWPPGGHAVYLDAGRFADHIPPLGLPGISLTVELYRLGGIRSVEIGTAMYGHRDPDSGEEHPAPHELVRLTIPRRAYTQSHLDYVIEVVVEQHKRRADMGAFRFVHQEAGARHFTARFERA